MKVLNLEKLFSFLVEYRQKFKINVLASEFKKRDPHIKNLQTIYQATVQFIMNGYQCFTELYVHVSTCICRLKIFNQLEHVHLLYGKTHILLFSSYTHRTRNVNNCTGTNFFYKQPHKNSCTLPNRVAQIHRSSGRIQKSFQVAFCNL